MQPITLRRFLVLGALLAAPAVAWAGSPSATPDVTPFQAVAGAPVSVQTLAGLHGKDIPDAVSFTGAVSGNSASGATGSIANNNSVTGNSGFTTVIQNTGNNALFQTSTIVNITLSH